MNKGKIALLQITPFLYTDNGTLNKENGQRLADIYDSLEELDRAKEELDFLKEQVREDEERRRKKFIEDVKRWQDGGMPTYKELQDKLEEKDKKIAELEKALADEKKLRERLERMVWIACEELSYGYCTDKSQRERIPMHTLGATKWEWQECLIKMVLEEIAKEKDNGMR